MKSFIVKITGVSEFNPPSIPPFRRGTSVDVTQNIEQGASSFVKPAWQTDREVSRLA